MFDSQKNVTISVIFLPLASFSCCLSFSRFSFDTPVAIPRAPATSRLAAIAEVSGRGLYGCKNSEICKIIYGSVSCKVIYEKVPSKAIHESVSYKVIYECVMQYYI